MLEVNRAEIPMLKSARQRISRTHQCMGDRVHPPGGPGAQQDPLWGHRVGSTVQGISHIAPEVGSHSRVGMLLVISSSLSVNVTLRRISLLKSCQMTLCRIPRPELFRTMRHFGLQVLSALRGLSRLRLRKESHS